MLHNANVQIDRLTNNFQQRINRLIEAQDNETNERLAWWFRTQRLIREKAALQILNKRNKAAADLAEFNQAWVFNKYQKWKAWE